MRDITRFSLCVLFALGVSQGIAQELVSVTSAGSFSRTTIQLIVSQLVNDVEVTYGADVYRVEYTTTGSDMMQDTASGLLAIPQGTGTVWPLLNYQHGTTNGRSDVPSNSGSFEFFSAVGMASVGFVTFAPDYVGMGESRGFHPYVHEETEGQAAVDMLFAVKDFLFAEGIEFSDQLLVMGYSQGGHAAMSTHRLIEEQYADELQVTANLSMSGPYSLSGVMRDLIIGDREFFYPSYLVYAILGMKAVNPGLYDSLDEVFKPEYLDIITPFAETGENLSAMNLELIRRLQDSVGSVIPKQILQDSVLQLMIEDLDHPINMALQESDVHNWVPEAPVLMLYCEGDDQVPYQNTIVADSTMNALGAANVESQHVPNGEVLDHFSCSGPALQIGIPWLLSFVDERTSVAPIIELSENLIYPNPASQYIQIKPYREPLELVEIYNYAGEQVLYKQKLQGNTLYMNDLTSGQYTVVLHYNSGLVVQKLILN